MAIVSATECTILTNINASATTIVASGLIGIIQERIITICNNYFTSRELYLASAVDFNATNRTIISDGGDYDSVNFLAGDNVLVSGSYRNDDIYELASVAGSTLTVISSQSVVAELSGASVLISLIKWPRPVTQAAALMIAYDYDARPKNSDGLISHSLGPFSETFSSGDNASYGYPKNILDLLTPYRMARVY
jgi:hypothetical protein